jgi:ribosomal protein S18
MSDPKRIDEARALLSALDPDGTSAALDAMMVKKRTAHLDRAVALDIIDYGQRCALLQLFIDELGELRDRERAAHISDELRALGNRITEP